MTKITFLGATGTVTGSRFLLESQGKTALVDCGLFQGKKEIRSRNWEPFPFSPKEIERVFLTHAHIDHTGFLPRLCKEGFSGPVFCTRATHDLCEIMLRDSAHLQEEDAFWANKKGFSKHDPALPLYTVQDAETALSYFQSLNYGQDYYADNSEIRVKFKDAGHILGSSFIEFKNEYGPKTRKILFSGDFGRANQTIIKQPTQVFNVDYLILESTYGDREHDKNDVSFELTRIVNEAYERGGVLIIPAFAVGRTQTLLYMLRELEEMSKIPILDVYVDSPMAINSLKVFQDHVPEFSLEARMKALKGAHVFTPKKLHICKTRDESIKINNVKNKAIIISSSGMVTGGRILHHMIQRLPDSQNTVLFIGYQAEGTRGRTIMEGKPEVKIHGQYVPINAKIEHFTGMSAHGDYNEILAWLLGFNKAPERTFIVHGEPDSSEAMAKRIREAYAWDVVVPKMNESYELDF